MTNYDDGNTLHHIASTIEAVLRALMTDTKTAIDWFINNYMFLKHFRCKVDVPDSIEIDSITITHQSDAKLLGMTIDDKLCKSAARQLNVMYRIKNIFYIKDKENIYNNFILANFNYCPTIWHLCGKINTKKIERIQERALRFMFNDHCSTYSALLDKCSYATLRVRRIKTIACEVFKSINKLNPVFMHDIFKTKDLSYQLRDNDIVYQPKFKGITYGKHTFAYYGSHIWNALLNQVKESTDLKGFKILLKTWGRAQLPMQYV